MKITVNIREDDYEWLKLKAAEAIKSQNQRPDLKFKLTSTPDDVIKHALQSKALSTITEQLEAWIEQGQRLSGGKTKETDQCTLSQQQPTVS